MLALTTRPDGGFVAGGYGWIAEERGGVWERVALSSPSGDAYRVLDITAVGSDLFLALGPEGLGRVREGVVEVVMTGEELVDASRFSYSDGWVAHVEGDGTGGLWAASSNVLVRFGPDGRVVQPALRSAGFSGAITSLAVAADAVMVSIEGDGTWWWAFGSGWQRVDDGTRVAGVGGGFVSASPSRIAGYDAAAVPVGAPVTVPESLGDLWAVAGDGSTVVVGGATGVVILPGDAPTVHLPAPDLSAWTVFATEQAVWFQGVATFGLLEHTGVLPIGVGAAGGHVAWLGGGMTLAMNIPGFPIGTAPDGLWLADSQTVWLVSGATGEVLSTVPLPRLASALGGVVDGRPMMVVDLGDIVAWDGTEWISSGAPLPASASPPMAYVANDSVEIAVTAQGSVALRTGDGGWRVTALGVGRVLNVSASDRGIVVVAEEGTIVLTTDGQIARRVPTAPGAYPFGFLDHNSVVWTATDAGLYCTDGGPQTAVDLGIGLPIPGIRHASMSPAGDRLWIALASGLTMLDDLVCTPDAEGDVIVVPLP